MTQNYLPVVSENHNTNVVSLQVEGHTLDAGVELHHLTGLNFGETEHTGNTVTDGDDSSELLQVVLNANWLGTQKSRNGL